MTASADAMPIDALRIGALAPLTPPGWVEAGRNLLAGLELAVRDINAAGGVLKRPLALVVRDTAADPGKAAAAVDELAELGVAALAGEYHSVAARAAAARAEVRGLPFLCSSAVLDALVDRPSDVVARLAPAQSHGWRIYAEFLLGAGHRRIALAMQPSLYWAAGARILRDRLEPGGGSVAELDAAGDAASVCDALAAVDATALLLLCGHPEPGARLVAAIRQDARLAGVMIGAPAGQPEFADWVALLGRQGAAVPFLRYRPDRLTALGQRVEAELRGRLGDAPSFVALEGYDAIAALAEALRLADADPARIAGAWPRIDREGTRGRLRFDRPPGDALWRCARPAVQVVERDPQRLERFRVLAED